MSLTNKTDVVDQAITHDPCTGATTTTLLPVTNSELMQVAAFAYNETFDDQTVDKFRVTSAIMNRDE